MCCVPLPGRRRLKPGGASSQSEYGSESSVTDPTTLQQGGSPKGGGRVKSLMMGVGPTKWRICFERIDVGQSGTIQIYPILGAAGCNLYLHTFYFLP